MIIVYISLAVFAASLIYLEYAALIYLGYSALKSFKEAKPSIERLTAATAAIQLKAEHIKNEVDEITVTQQEIQRDFLHKKHTLNSAVSAAKETPKKIKKWWSIKIPFIHKI